MSLWSVNAFRKKLPMQQLNSIENVWIDQLRPLQWICLFIALPTLKSCYGSTVNRHDDDGESTVSTCSNKYHVLLKIEWLTQSWIGSIWVEMSSCLLPIPMIVKQHWILFRSFQFLEVPILLRHLRFFLSNNEANACLVDILLVHYSFYRTWTRSILIHTRANQLFCLLRYRSSKSNARYY